MSTSDKMDNLQNSQSKNQTLILTEIGNLKKSQFQHSTSILKEVDIPRESQTKHNTLILEKIDGLKTSHVGTETLISDKIDKVRDSQDEHKSSIPKQIDSLKESQIGTEKLVSRKLDSLEKSQTGIESSISGKVESLEEEIYDKFWIMENIQWETQNMISNEEDRKKHPSEKIETMTKEMKAQQDQHFVGLNNAVLDTQKQIGTQPRAHANTSTAVASRINDLNGIGLVSGAVDHPKPPIGKAANQVHPSIDVSDPALPMKRAGQNLLIKPAPASTPASISSSSNSSSYSFQCSRQHRVKCGQKWNECSKSSRQHKVK